MDIINFTNHHNPLRAKAYCSLTEYFVKGRFKQWKVEMRSKRFDLRIYVYYTFNNFHCKDSPVAQLVRALH